MDGGLDANELSEVDGLDPSLLDYDRRENPVRGLFNTDIDHIDDGLIYTVNYSRVRTRQQYEMMQNVQLGGGGGAGGSVQAVG